MITSVVLSPAVDKIYCLDHFEAGKLYRANDVVTSAGGKGINVARVASILGAKVCTVGFKAGNTGEWLESKQKELGIETWFISVNGESRTNNNIIDRYNKTETEILETGPLITHNDIANFLEVYSRVLKNTKILVCSGGLPEGVPVDFYRTLIEIARTFEIKVILDSNGDMLKEGIKAKPYMIKPNLRELSKYAGKQLVELKDIVEVCRGIVSIGIEIVVASLGKDGAIMVSCDKALYIKAPDIDVINTIGSGDAMVAGFAIGLSNSGSPEEVFMNGMACALANTQFKGIGLVNRELVEKYSKEVVIRNVFMEGRNG